MTSLRVFAAAWILASAPATADEAMRILTYPIGLVAGEMEVRADLGPEGRPADLYLDGWRACSLAAAQAACTVDLGADPRVHLLELIRGDGERVARWVNRPGQEAELELTVARPEAERCEARLAWAHPLRQDPLELALTLDGAPLALDPERRAAPFPCPPADASRLLVASGVFADGRRVEAGAVVGGFADEAEVAPVAVPLVADAGAAACEAGSGSWPASAERLEQGGYEVVFVLDPDAAYRPLLSHRTVDTSRALGTKARAKLQGAERLWFVLPNRHLYRVNGFAKSPANWLGYLFEVGRTEIEGKPRIADAVAASGLVAAAGPRRRAVVLILGNGVAERDGSLFTPRQAREYLAEVGVPLVVLRHGKRRDDGWPAGLPALGEDGIAKNLGAIEDVLDRQCLAWFPRELDSEGLAAALPAGVRVAGRGGDAPASPESVWARAEIEPEELLADVGGMVAERLDVTAVTVLVTATGDGGRPVRDLTAGDLEVLEDSSPVALLELAAVAAPPAAPPAGSGEAAVAPAPVPAGKDVPVAVYVDRSLGGGADLRFALRAVSGEVERLAALGPVEVVEADGGQVRTLVGPTRDAAALAESLDELTRRRGAVNAVERIRRRFIESIRQTPSLTRRPKPPGRAVFFTAQASAGEEDVILSRALERLRFWALREAGHRAGLLLVVGAGFDEDPARFYQGFVDKLEPHNSAQMRAQLIEPRHSPEVGALGRELAGTGWRVLAVAGQATGTSTLAADSRTDKVSTFLSAGANAIGADAADWLLLDPIGSQRHLAEASGGDAVVGSAGLGAALDAAGGWYLLSYQVARPPDGEAHELDIRPLRPGVEVTSSRVVTAATSEGQAGARAVRLLGGATERGELALHVSVEAAAAGRKGWRQAQIEATVDFRELAAVIHRMAGPKTLRVSIAVAAGDAEPTVEHRDERLMGEPGGWIYTFPLEWPDSPGARLAVTVEALASGLWGGAVVELSRNGSAPG